jgi:hypothetical protein
MIILLCGRYNLRLNNREHEAEKSKIPIFGGKERFPPWNTLLLA